MKLWQKYLPFPQVLEVVEGDFNTKCNQEPLATSLKLDTLDANIIMHDRVGEYGLEGSI